MSIIDEARKLQTSDFAFAIGIFISIIAPGFLTIYNYKPALIESLDTFKLLTFSAALTFPAVIANFIFSGALASDKARDKHTTNFVMAMTMTCLTFYASLLTSYFAALTFKWFIVSIIAFQCISFLIIYIDHRNSEQ